MAINIEAFNEALDLSYIEVLIKDHLKTQPYSTICANCGEELETKITHIDNDLDITIEVTPCKCFKEGD